MIIYSYQLLGGVKMKVKANAKINLLLDVTGVKKNGYHRLYTVMQSVSLYDILSVEKTDDDRIIITCNDDTVPVDEKNIAYKAAAAFYQKLGINENRGLRISIEKNIPSLSGLGGGSADGAAVFKVLNEFYGFPFSDRELVSISSEVGADIPFIIVGGTALCEDIGSVVAPLPSVKDFYFVIVRPEGGSSTKTAYEEIDSGIAIRHPKGELMVDEILDFNFREAFRYCANVFEQVIEVPKRVDIKEIMNNCGALAACMSGSGTAVYGIFENKKDAENCRCLLEKKYDRVYICEPVEKGVEVIK